MNTRIFYLRHAQSQVNVEEDTAHWTLSALGYQQAEKLAQVLGATKFTKIYTSPYRRCIETIAPYCKKYDQKYERCDDLKERRLVLNYNKKNYQEVHRKSWIYFSFALPGCESSHVAQDRIVSTLKMIARLHAGEQVLVSGHGQLLALLLNHIDSRFAYKNQSQIFNPDLRIFDVTQNQIIEKSASNPLCDAVKKIAVPAVKF